MRKDRLSEAAMGESEGPGLGKVKGYHKMLQGFQKVLKTEIEFTVHYLCDLCKLLNNVTHELVVDCSLTASEVLKINSSWFGRSVGAIAPSSAF